MIRKAGGVQASLGDFRFHCMTGITGSLSFQTTMCMERFWLKVHILCRSEWGETNIQKEDEGCLPNEHVLIPSFNYSFIYLCILQREWPQDLWSLYLLLNQPSTESIWSKVDSVLSMGKHFVGYQVFKKHSHHLYSICILMSSISNLLIKVYRSFMCLMQMLHDFIFTI